MKISNDIIEDIRRANDIVDVVAPYVQLKKRGKNFIGLCPFHSEKTPSFTVSAEKQMYHCFGCGKGGNVFTFLMEVERLTFPEAVRSLASRAGITIPSDTTETTQTHDKRERLYALCAFAAEWFYKNLTTTKEGNFALTYCVQRGLQNRTIQDYGIGYSPKGWETFVNYAVSKGYSADELVNAGLARRREDGSLYDYFRGRLMFPIMSPNGKFIGFGARKLYDDDQIEGKYINSPETIIYNKSQTLYGLYQAKDAIRKEDAVLLVEGYMDLLALTQAGFLNVVASSGTALTEEQLALLSRYTHNLYLVYDADAAGSSATVRGIDLALEKNYQVHVVSLPNNEDPDSFVRTYGANEFREHLKNALPWIDFKAQELFNSPSAQSPDGKALAIRLLIQTIAKIPDELRQNMYIKEIAEKYKVYESILFQELEQHKKKGQREKFSSGRTAKKIAPKQSNEQVQSRLPSTIQPLSAEERDLLKVMLEGNPEVIEFVLSHIEIDNFTNPGARTLVELIQQHYEEFEGNLSHALLEMELDPNIKNLLSELMLARYTLSHGWQDMEIEIDEANPFLLARDAVVAFHRRLIKQQIELNKEALKEATLVGESATPFLQRQQELLQQLKRIESPDYLKLEP